MCCRLACTSIMCLSRDNYIIRNTMTSSVKVGLSSEGTAYGVFFCRNRRSPKWEVLCWEHVYMSPFSHSHAMHATFALKPITALKRNCRLSALRWVRVSSVTCNRLYPFYLYVCPVSPLFWKVISHVSNEASILILKFLNISYVLNCFFNCVLHYRPNV